MNIIPPRTGDILHDPFSLIGWLDRIRQVLNSVFSSAITNSLSGDVALNDIAAYFDGPSCAQGTVGKWFASGTVCFTDTAGTANYIVRLTDGTTIMAGCFSVTAGAGGLGVASVSGIITNPAGNIRIQVRDQTSTSGKIQSNPSATSGNKESTLTVFRIG